ncbi:MAG: GNAT family N-acetyltransferase [Microbacteriaceae bacterium]|nr:GNAT family N-acetyltransferase [Microbacteriaceae bacterium]
MTELRLEELSAATVLAVNSLTLKPGQEQFVTPVTYAASAAVIPEESAWQRVVVNSEGRVVGFIHANFDPEARQPEFRAALWRINVAADAQGTGIGTFIVRELVEEARRRDVKRLTVLWESGDMGPEKFFLHMGFKPIGETEYGDIIGAYDID